MKTLLKILLGIVCLLLIFALWIHFSPIKQYDASSSEVVITSDSLTLSHGEYLIFGPAHCAGCHSSPSDYEAVRQGQIVSLTGGRSFNTPLGEIFIPNITPDEETGIGNLTNDQIARAMRYGVNHRNNVMIQVMPFTHMSDSDVSAVISYLRYQKPVVNEVPQTEYTFMGKLMTRFLLRPMEASEPIPNHIEADTTIDYGRYLVHSVANCSGCHTPFSMWTMAYDDPPLGGGNEMGGGGKFSFVTPNLTPDPETGFIVNWSEETFVNRFKAGSVYEGSPMPWNMFKRMSDTDLKAIYRYLQTVEPVKNEVPTVAILKTEE